MEKSNYDENVNELKVLLYIKDHPTTLKDVKEKKTLVLVDFDRICAIIKEVENVSIAHEAINSLIKKEMIARGIAANEFNREEHFYTLTLKGKKIIREMAAILPIIKENQAFFYNN